MKSGTTDKEIIFSDEFTIEATVNNQNDRVYAKSSAVVDESMRTVYRRKKSLSIIKWAAVSKSWKSPLIFMEQRVKINTDLYLKILWFQLLER